MATGDEKIKCLLNKIKPHYCYVAFLFSHIYAIEIIVGE